MEMKFQLFLWVLTRIEQFSILLVCSSPGPLVRETRLLSGCFYFYYLSFLPCQLLQNPIRDIGGKKKTQELIGTT
jgi:hypothetical protein